MKKNTQALLSIGASAEAVKEARAAIMGILNYKASDENKNVVLRTLSSLCSVSGTVISGNTFAQ